MPIVFGAIFFGFHWPTDPTAIVLLPLSILLAVCVSFACRFMVNLTAFWLTEVRGLVLLYVLVSGLLGGHLVPVQLFPDWLQAAAYVTPFPAMIQFPINLVTGQATGLACGRRGRGPGRLGRRTAAARPARAVAGHPASWWCRVADGDDRRGGRSQAHWRPLPGRGPGVLPRVVRGSSSARRCSSC